MDDFDTTGRSPFNRSRTTKRHQKSYLKQYLKRYLKQYPTLAMFDRVLQRNLYNHTGNSFIKQYCVPVQFRKEVLFRIHNSVWSGHKGVLRIIAEFGKRFYFPNFTGTLTGYIRNSVTCLQTKFNPTSALRPLLKPMPFLQNFRADVLLIDFVEKLHPSP